MLDKTLEDIIKMMEISKKDECYELDQCIHPADLLEQIIHREDLHEILIHMPNRVIAEILEVAEKDERIKLLNHFTDEEKSRILGEMACDDAAHLIGDMDEEEKTEVIELLDQQTRNDVETILQYDSETAGSIMTTEFLSVNEDMTIEFVLNYIRANVDAETTYYIYVVDREKHLKGVVGLRDIVCNEKTVLMKEILNPVAISIPYYMDQEDVAHMFEKYGFLLMPVVDDDNHMIGVVTVDDILDVIEDEMTEDIHRMAGINKEEKVGGSVKDSIRSRLPWLIINLITALLASAVIDLFADTIAKIVALSAVMTIISGMGGNAGTQTLTIIIRGISLGEIKRENAWHILRKEIAVGVATGIVIGLFVAGIAVIYESNPFFGLIAAVAMLLNMVCAAIAGFAVPVILNRLHIDPALASGVFVTTVTDVLGFLFFLGLATVAMPYL